MPRPASRLPRPLRGRCAGYTARARASACERSLARRRSSSCSSVALGLAFAGSPERLARRHEIAGVDVGGMTAGRRRGRCSSERSRELANVPVVFTAAGSAGGSKPSAARRRRRLGRRGRGGAARRATASGRSAASGASACASSAPRSPRRAGLPVARSTLHGRRLARGVDRRSASRRSCCAADAGVVPGREGSRARPSRRARRSSSRRSRLSRAQPVAAAAQDRPRTSVTAADLARGEGAGRTALSAPVRPLGPARCVCRADGSPGMLVLPSNGPRSCGSAGRGPTHYFARSRRAVERAPKDARFAVCASDASASFRRSRDARSTCQRRRAPARRRAFADEPRGATSPSRRRRPSARPRTRTAMGITGLVGTYKTFYGGDREPDPQRPARRAPDRRHADRAWATTFSFNGTTGERNARRASSRRR